LPFYKYAAPMALSIRVSFVFNLWMKRPCPSRSSNARHRAPVEIEHLNILAVKDPND